MKVLLSNTGENLSFSAEGMRDSGSHTGKYHPLSCVEPPGRTEPHIPTFVMRYMRGTVRHYVYSVH
jgi:hypothetical protein